MPTYASPNIIKTTLLLINSLIFLIGSFIFVAGVIDVINLRTNEFEYNLEEESEKLELLNQTISTNFTAVIDDRFPSSGAPSVIVIFGVISIIESVLGTLALNKQDLRLLSSYSICLVIGLFIRFVFLFATVCMYGFTIDYNPIRITTLLSASIATIQVIVIPFVCHFAKSIKRGEPQQIERLAEPETWNSWIYCPRIVFTNCLEKNQNCFLICFLIKCFSICVNYFWKLVIQCQ